MNNLKPEEYNRVLSSMPDRYYTKANDHSLWVIANYPVIKSALTCAAQPKPNHAELEVAIMEIESGLKHSKPLMAWKENIIPLLKAARSQLSGQSDGCYSRRGREQSVKLMSSDPDGATPSQPTTLESQSPNRTHRCVRCGRTSEVVRLDKGCPFCDVQPPVDAQELDAAIKVAEEWVSGDDKKCCHITTHDVCKLPKAAKSHRQSLDSMELVEALEDIASNYDHDEDAHRYNTPCRVCTASTAIAKYKSQSLGG